MPFREISDDLRPRYSELLLQLVPGPDGVQRFMNAGATIGRGELEKIAQGIRDSAGYSASTTKVKVS